MFTRGLLLCTGKQTRVNVGLDYLVLLKIQANLLRELWMGDPIQTEQYTSQNAKIQRLQLEATTNLALEDAKSIVSLLN